MKKDDDNARALVRLSSVELERGRDDPEQIRHDVRDEQVRVDCIPQTAQVPSNKEEHYENIIKKQCPLESLEQDGQDTNLAGSATKDPFQEA